MLNAVDDFVRNEDTAFIGRMVIAGWFIQGKQIPGGGKGVPGVRYQYVIQVSRSVVDIVSAETMRGMS